MEFIGRSAEQILHNTIFDHSSWHFFQARSWLDYAQRTQLPSSIHYAAFELRYGIEYLLFELLVLANESLTHKEYEKCLGDPTKMKKMLGTLGTNYHRLAEFSEILFSLTPSQPKIRFWDIDQLFRYWGTASEYLHFVGAQTLTYRDVNWLIKAIAHLDEPLKKLWDVVTGTLGTGIMRPSKMQPEVRSAWIEFSNGRLAKDDLIIRMRLIQPILQARPLI